MAVITNTVKPEQYHTDLLSLTKKLQLVLTIPFVKGSAYITISILAIVEPLLLALFTPLFLLLFFSSPRFEFPSRAPFESNRIDKSDPLDSGKGFNKARGEVYFGWHRGTGKEAWTSWNDMLTHLYMLAATGGGKSEAIWAILSNFYLCGSAYSMGDGKGTLEMIQNGRVLARIFGVEDDYFVINYINPNPEKKYKLMSNSMNTWSSGTAAQLKEQMASLALSGDAGANQYFEDNAEVIIERIFPALCELRDKGFLQLDIQVIGSYLSLPRMYELSCHPALSPYSSRNITDHLKTAGFNFDTPEKQSDEVQKQHAQFVSHFSKIISSLSIQYRDIYVVDQGDINQKDITSNRRTLMFALPSLEKSGSELKNLGKILLTGQKNAISTDLGDELEGTREKTTSRLSKNHSVPYGLAFDEWSFYAIQDMALLPAQIRGLKYCGLYAAQDYKGTERAGEMDAEQVFANTRVKLFGALEEAGASWTRIRDLIGEFLVAINANYKYLPGIFGGKQIIDRERTEITKRAPIEIGDLQKQISGEFFMFQRGKLSPIRFFYTDLEGLDKKAAKGNGFKINRLCRVYAPSDDAIESIDRNETFLNIIFSGGKLFNNIDSLAPLKKELSRLITENGNLTTIDHVSALTTFVEANALKFGLRLSAPKKPNPIENHQISLSPAQRETSPPLIPQSDTSDDSDTKVIDNPTPTVELTNVENAEADLETIAFSSPEAGNDTLDTFLNMAEPVFQKHPHDVSAIDFESKNEPKSSALDIYLGQYPSELSEATIESKVAIMEGYDDTVGAHILSENEAKRIVSELTQINSLLGFSPETSVSIAQKTVNNLHKYCYYLAPPKPNSISQDIISELDARIEQILT
ncbi:hypothetical protein [Cellvibrio sp. QJXJ]|uniref:hypothetical protein n=1 Tax=Cellvibrio sp. QJXJ TaxID=2964606 RepID=UPI0021C259C9|nr:hypothetical protein [Cellvibrio sp. QJXJ]UUA75122.1 hypothetical protein NNX04_21950 [Cellvibrio sp. QJXJ]